MNSLCKVFACRFPSTHVTKWHTCGKCGMFGHGLTECNSNSKKHALEHHTSDLPHDLWCGEASCFAKEKHTTAGHRCEMCGVFGHGETRCTLATRYKKKQKDVQCPLCRAKCTFQQVIVVHELMSECPICLSENEHKKVCFPCGHQPMCTDCLNNISSQKKSIDVTDTYAELIQSKLSDAPNNSYTVVNVGMGCCVFGVKDSTGECNAYFLHSDLHGQYGEDLDDRPIIAQMIFGKTRV